MFYRINQFAVKGYESKIQIALSILISNIYKPNCVLPPHIFRLFCVLMDNLFYKVFAIAYSDTQKYVPFATREGHEKVKK